MHLNLIAFEFDRFSCRETTNIRYYLLLDDISSNFVRNIADGVNFPSNV